MTDELREKIAKFFMEGLTIEPLLRYGLGNETIRERAEFAYGNADQLLSLFEPVQLEALGDEEIDKVWGFRHEHSYKPISRRLIQATIQHNQSKGQLFRLKEVKHGEGKT